MRAPRGPPAASGRWMTALLSFLAATKIMVVAIKARSVGPERRPGARGDALGRADKVIRERPTPSPSAAEAIARTGLVGDGNRRRANRRPAATPPLVRGQLPPGAPFAPSRPLPRPPQRMFPARSLASATSSRSPSIAVLICDNTMRAVSDPRAAFRADRPLRQRVLIVAWFPSTQGTPSSRRMRQCPPVCLPAGRGRVQGA